MAWRLSIVVAIAAALMLPAAPEAVATATADHKPGGATPDRKKKSSVKRKSRGVGFLPGYRTPEQLRRIEHRPRYWDYDGGLYYFGGPRWYGGRWNGGSFGPCWTNSPIGLQWSCGQ
jgi:hypothetical protein